MKTDKKTLDELFEIEIRARDKIESAKYRVASAEEYAKKVEQNIVSAAETCIFDIVADPDNPKRANIPTVTYDEIQERMSKKEPRFTQDHMNRAIAHLVRTGKISRDAIEIRCYYGIMNLTIYQLPEEKKK